MTLIEYLPDFYADSPEVMRIQVAIQSQTEALRAARDGLMAQLMVNTATWGLDAWERALALRTDAAAPVAYRRTRVLSKLRGAGTTTVAMIKNVAESFSNGEVDVTEDPAVYRIDIKFVIPPNMEDLTAAIEEIKPAHMEYDYIFIYRTYGVLAIYTNADLAAYTHGTIREGEL